MDAFERMDLMSADDFDNLNLDDFVKEYAVEPDEVDTEVEADASIDDADGETEDTDLGESDEEELDDDVEESDDLDTEEGDERLEGLLAPLSRHGKEIKIKDDEHARRLMSMGLDYVEKTTAMKADRKFLRLLENNDLKDEAALQLAIDAAKGNKSAIKQLVQKHNLDLFDIDEAGKYTPTVNTDPKREQFDDVVDELKESPTFKDTLSTVDGWDEASKQVIAENPNALAWLDAHRSNGIYEKIVSEMEQQRYTGELIGLTDLQAYQQVGSKLAERGEFGESDGSTNKKQTKADAKRNIRKRKAKGSKTPAQAPKAAPKDPFDMSDEEFANFKLY